MEQDQHLVNPTQPEQPKTDGSQPVQQKTNIFAILGIISVLIMWPLAIIFGIVALVQIKNDPNQKGKGLAIAAIVLGVAVIPLVLMFIGFIAYFGVLDPGAMLPNKCSFGVGMDCTETASIDSTAGTVKFPLINSNGYEIQGISASSDICQSGTSSIDPLSNGQSTVITLTGCNFESERYMDNIEITYTSTNTGVQHKNMGSIYSQIN